ncbi:MAG: hypothetical protein HQ512_12390 [Rhodospirillales bacterium]|nr:hypothetical protein [Rhodospirillales bacterium]
MDALKAGNAKGALRHLNQALALDTTNSGLNLLVGMAYHLQAVRGDESRFDLAREGYKLAIKFDPSNWIAQYQLGLLHMDQRNYALAQGRFAEALLFRSTDMDLLYDMTAASYYARDPQTAVATLSRLQALEPESARVLRATPIVHAAVGNPGASVSGLKRLAVLEKNTDRVRLIRARVSDWQQFHAELAEAPSNVELAQADEPPTEEEIDPANKMVMVDVTIIRTEEDYTTSSGVNLLNGLQLRFGDDSTSALSYKRVQETGASPSNKKTLTSLIGIPAITFSLNIANANDNRAEVLARPTLTAKNGEESSFFSGVTLSAAEIPTGGSDGSGFKVEDKEIGVSLKLTPSFLEKGQVQMAVEAERTFLKTPNEAYTGFTSKLEISKTMVQANVVMKFGETLILSGLSEREVENNRDGVPFLQDIPLVQYFFSNKTTQDYTKSALILITPREPGEIYEGDSADAGGGGAAMASFKKRFSDWFKPRPNIASALFHLRGNSLYREFRTGDLTMEHWSTRQGLEGRLKGALDFLYY